MILRQKITFSSTGIALFSEKVNANFTNNFFHNVPKTCGNTVLLVAHVFTIIEQRKYLP